MRDTQYDAHRARVMEGMSQRAEERAKALAAAPTACRTLAAELVREALLRARVAPNAGDAMTFCNIAERAHALFQRIVEF